jgi:hypothetical protein
MRRWLLLAALSGFVAACALAPPEPDREVFGVSATRPAGAGPAASDAQAQSVLEWKASQICTIGWDTVGERVDPAEEGQEMPDRELRCTRYRLALPFIGPLPLPTLALYGF